MQPKTAIFGGLAALALVACDLAPTAPSDECFASRYQALVGQPVAGANLPDSLSVRVIERDTLVTLDFVPTRMNVRVGADGLITRIGCG